MSLVGEWQRFIDLPREKLTFRPKKNKTHTTIKHQQESPCLTCKPNLNKPSPPAKR